MKKSFLLLAAGLVAGIANGQVSTLNSVVAPVTNPVHASMQSGPQRISVPSPERFHSGARTSATGRWYDYNNMYMDAYASGGGLGYALSFINPTLWNDTTALIGYTGTVPGPWAPYEFNQEKSIGSGLDPMFNYWNAVGGPGGWELDFTGEPAVRRVDAYTVDSIQIVGWYQRGYLSYHNTSAVVDTLVVTFVQGDGSSTGDLPSASISGSVVPLYCPLCAGSMPYVDMFHDAVNNRAAHNGGTPVTAANAVYKFLLMPSDTNNLAPKNSIFPRPGHVPTDPAISYSVTPGNYIASTITFKSGDPSAYLPHGGHPGDTIRLSDGTSVTQKMNSFEMQVNYMDAGSSTPTFDIQYNSANRANGEFDFEGGGWAYNPAKYYEQYDIISTLGPPPTANGHQAPRISYHTVCPTCLLVGTPALQVAKVDDIHSVGAHPNPADNNLSITWSGALNAKTSVTLTNMLGQVVATQATTHSQVSINTSSLPAGLYVFTVAAEGQKPVTGRVSVAH